MRKIFHRLGAARTHAALRRQSTNLVFAFTIALVSLFTLATSQAEAQTYTCPSQTSFQFPLWSDGINWNLPARYNSIQMADVDGDGQDELLGYGPFGIEVWHWEPLGESWIRMTGGTPRFGATDILETADVNGDGQAEIIQITPDSAGNPMVTVNVWHYDVVPQVWRLQPQLQALLQPSTIYNGPLQPVRSAPIIQFVDLHNTGKQELVYLQTQAVGVFNPNSPPTYGLFTVDTPIVMEVNSDLGSWTTTTGSPTNVPGIIVQNGALKFGDVTGDGLPDLVFRQGKGFVVFAQETPSSDTPFSFARGDYESPANGFPLEYPFALGDITGKGTSYIIATPLINPIPTQTQVYRYVAKSPLQTQSAIQTSLQGASQFSTLQAVTLGTNPLNKNAVTVFELEPNALAEYAYKPATVSWSVSSTTPFINQSRFGGDPSYYTTIQFGKVFYGTSTTPRPILIARDPSGIHTLTYSTNICESGVAGFSLPQVKYFPTFLGGQAAAYSYLSNLLVAGNFNIRSIYANEYASLPAYAATLADLQYPANHPAIKFTQADFDAVKAQMGAELLAASNAASYFNSSAAQINVLFSGEEAALPTILTALNLPTDQSTTSGAGAFFGNLLTQLVGSFFSYFGISEDNAKGSGLSQDGANEAALAVSILNDIISDAASLPTTEGGGSGLGSATLNVENQVASLHQASATSNAVAQTLTLQNWDLMHTLSDEIGNGNVAVSSQDEDQAVQSALTQFQIGAWQTLAPQVWQVCFQNASGDHPEEYYPWAQTDPGYPYFVITPSSSPLDKAQNVVWAAYLSLSSQCNSPVAQAALDEVTSLGVNFYDTVGQRNGWQSIPLDPALLGDVLGTVPPDPVTTPPNPVIGAPAMLTIVGGGEETAQTQTCSATPAPILKQSTPVNSVFPNPLVFMVADINGNGVPNATIQISGTGIYPVTPLTTDSTGAATTTLVANGHVSTDYLITATVTSPAADPSATPCALSQQYDLENTPGLSGGNVPGGLLVAGKITGKTGTTAASTLSLTVTDQTGMASAMTINGINFQQTSGVACQPTITSPLPLVLNGPDASGNFMTNFSVNASSCTGVPMFTLQFSLNGIITLTDGTSYPVPSSFPIFHQPF